MKRAGGLGRAATLTAVGGLAVLAALGPVQGAEHGAPEGEACREPGTWLDPASGNGLAADALLGRLAGRRVVLLGEKHNDAEHHRWQLHTLAALYGRKANMVIGFEMFPRRVQPALDRWVKGELDVESFLEAADWKKVWAFDPELYLPLFHFARQNRIPMVALNVERSLVTRVGGEGWAAVPGDEREGVSDPKPASQAYRESLARVYAEKQILGLTDEEVQAEEDGDAPDLAAIMEREDFTRFVEAQLTWDRAMAEALAEAARRAPGALIVGIVGRGHAEHGYSVPYQLADLGVEDSAVLLPVSAATLCEPVSEYLADAVFVVEQPDRVEADRPKPRLGIMIETAEGGVRVMTVLDGSVAQETGFEVDDIVLSAAGFPVATVGDLIEIVQRQAPGTWLPLTIRRGDAELDVLAKFPSRFPDAE
ncbi:MAG: ChaN family lipoprotein [Rhodospirillales bacterium]|nr:ChaN family lipoprotein [Rhodospirillales bacterium]